MVCCKWGGHLHTCIVTYINVSIVIQLPFNIINLIRAPGFVFGRGWGDTGLVQNPHNMPRAVTLPPESVHFDDPSREHRLGIRECLAHTDQCAIRILPLGLLCLEPDLALTVAGRLEVRLGLGRLRAVCAFASILQSRLLYGMIALCAYRILSHKDPLLVFES